ncbi:MAG: cell division protein SepF [Candidatus Aenigmarchaeota archaeon]|nr:cell division protein SepF [Candidatus Aenigmarchaeota archaeon]
MVFKKLKRSIIGEIEDSDMPKEEFIEVGFSESGGSFGVSKPAGKIGIVIDKLVEFSDTERVLRAVRDGSLVFLKIKGMKEKDLGELKRSVEKIKKTVMAQNGDIVGVEQDWLILAPEFAKVAR